ncbi:MAG: NAD(P)-dependent dehydrogenase (short-subunit alcohol dehydrogenase family) [Salibacteraceae bacterium]|jgi:NAD(P)-dependent dehydrogenase (short-subunit alcohol dehydrogenase family)
MKSNYQINLEGKNILVIGASSGIGKECFKSAVCLGASVNAVARRGNLLKEIIQELPERKGNKCFEGDITDASFLDKLINELDPIDGLVFAAGTINPYPSKYLNEEFALPVFKVNVFACMNLVSALLRKKKINQRASLVFVSSVASTYPFEAGAAYCSSKAALETYAKTLAMEQAKYGIRVNCIAPAMVKTDIFKATIAYAGSEIMDKYEKAYLLGFGESDDVANCCNFLLSNLSKWITGQVFTLDGGYILGSLYKDTKPS